MAKPCAFAFGVIGTGAVLAFALALAASLVAFLGLAAVVLSKGERLPIRYSVGSLVARKWTVLITVLGLSLVVFVFAAGLMLSAGINQTLVSTGIATNAKVLRRGSEVEIASDLAPDQARLLSSAGEVATGDDGKSLASSELVVVVYMSRRSDAAGAEGANVTVRGVGPQALLIHPLEDLDGHMFASGTSEIVIGKSLVGRFKGATLGGTMRFARRDWAVVGIADHGGTAFDSEIWGDLDQMVSAFQRRPVSLTVSLKDRSGLAELAARIEADPQLNNLEIMSEPEYWAHQSKYFANYVGILGLVISAVFSLAAVLGATITMYSQVAARTSEVGTLRAIGFKGRAILFSFVCESVLLAFASGCLGAAGASVLHLLRFRTTNWQTYSEMAVGFRFSPLVLIASLGFAVLMGYAGGLLPAMRAARMPIVRAIRGELA